MTLFHEAVEVAARVSREALGEAATGATIVRDAVGLVTVVTAKQLDAAAADTDAAAARLHAALGAYSPGLGAVLLAPDDLIDRADVLESPDRVWVADLGVYLVDRQLTNQDWLRKPEGALPPLPVAVGFSVKGGVGRTTALGVWAWHLAREGRTVVAVDLDLEAPGLGALLLDEGPRLGLVDWLAEELVGQGDVLRLDDIVAESPIGRDTNGHVFVLPAFGRETTGYVPKLGRVTMPVVRSDGVAETLAHRLARLVRRLHDERSPDVVLVDARAGLHDIGAAAVTQLGAKVLLFVRDERQAWEAWGHLFDHLQRARTIRHGGPDDDLRWRLKMVGAQVGPLEADRRRLLDASYELWTRLYDQEPDGDGGAASPAAEAALLSFPRDAQDAPHHPWSIYFDDALRGASFADAADRPVWDAVKGSFGGFLAAATAWIFDDEEAE